MLLHPVVERVDLASLRRARLRGRGVARRWLPEAIQRVCFGRGWRQVRTWLRGKTASKTHHRSVQATSARGIADVYSTGASRIQSLRNAVALHYCTVQSKYLKSLPKDSVAVLDISFDESDQQAEICGTARIQSMMRLHGRLYWRNDRGAEA